MSIAGNQVVRFGPLLIEYDEGVLAPRTWTELQATWVVELAASAPQGRLVELCAGAGQIGLAAASLSGRDLVAVDLEPRACDHIVANAARAGLADRVEVRQGSLREALAPGEVFALITADPPWVASAELSGFPDDPLLAIDGGQDGLVVARECVHACHGHLRPGGSVLIQVGTQEQADRLLAEAALTGWADGGRRTAPASQASSGGVVLRLLHP